MAVDPPAAARIGSLCTGYGGLDLAVELVLGGRLTWYAETDRHATTILNRHWPDVPNLGDIRTIDWNTVAPVDIVTAGFPCQDISNAGRRAGITGIHSSLWTTIAAAVRVLRPQLVFVENVAALLRRGLDVVHADLAEIGYDTRWLCLRASDIGAPHRRDRLFLLATPTERGGTDAAHPVRP
ncbi:DNA (cytosine-5)-methyltransferase 1 [Micromonospora sp. Llam0]|uniref:DNA cytosine methyltransferase n=1 Tax=Micromonospora sp. Llam0 TaxID=2485143 RepID=UPI000F48DDA8|nr:DNA (cytosine-5-)-methyltransferase [Micromonospora sp. Llam0]ROO52874.1 DNA (cytosine-5)-methyltransferase 1 [Micromonospora sp. Llam0]